MILFLLCALLFPDSMHDYQGYEDYFLSKRAWFFGLLAVDLSARRDRHAAEGRAAFRPVYGNEYLIRTPLFVILCLTAIATDNRTFHRAFCRLRAGLSDILDMAAVRYPRLNAES